MYTIMNPCERRYATASVDVHAVYGLHLLVFCFFSKPLLLKAIHQNVKATIISLRQRITKNRPL